MNNTLAHSLRSFWTGSIRRQLILGVSLVHAVLMTIFIFHLVDQQRSFLNKQGLTQTGSLAETLAANSASWVLANDVIGLEEVVDSLKGYPGVQYAMVLSPLGRVLAHSDTAYMGQYITDEVSLSLLGTKAEEHVMLWHGQFADVAQPIIANGRHIGWARVAINQAEVSNNLDIVTRDGILYTVLAVVVGMLFAYFMAKGLTSGLHHLVDAANRLSRGDHEELADLEREDELGTLAVAFNDMAATIKSRESELRDAHDKLELRIQERTHQLQEEVEERKAIANALEIAKDRAELGTQVKSEFLANMSHELRTPLNAIIGFSDIMRLETFGAVGHLKYVDYVEHIHDAGEHLLQLINDVLDISAIEAGKLELSKREMALGETLDAMVEIVQPRAERKSISLTCTYPRDLVTLVADERRVRQIALNLLSNSIKYTEDGGDINVEVSGGNDALEFVVRDTGIGMTEAEVAKALEAFGRIDGPQTRSVQGTGLGLPLTKSLIEQHGGTLQIDSEPGRGTIATVTLPLL